MSPRQTFRMRGQRRAPQLCRIPEPRYPFVKGDRGEPWQISYRRKWKNCEDKPERERGQRRRYFKRVLFLFLSLFRRIFIYNYTNQYICILIDRVYIYIFFILYIQYIYVPSLIQIAIVV